MLGLGLALLVERFDRRIRDPDELADAYGVPLLGTIPMRPGFAEAGAEALPAADADAFALLRARIRYFNVDRDVRTLLLTSAIPGEGKTTIALNLALAEATSGNSQVLLLEADLRRPVLAKRLALQITPGLGEILARSATLDAALRRVPVPLRISGNGSVHSFNIITAGALPPNPAELLASRAMADLLRALAKRFDPIIIDSSPTSVIPDPMPLMRLVSGTIIVGRLGSITRDSARELREQLGKLKAPALGVVANAVTPKTGYYERHRYANSTHRQRSYDALVSPWEDATRGPAPSPSPSEPPAIPRPNSSARRARTGPDRRGGR